MLPIELEIENFYSHGHSKIDFGLFESAVIVGKINDNDKSSNGAGKSTIFSALKYVLFNEVDTSSLEKVIKHGEDSCRVSFTFKSSLDDEVYKIVRFRGRKSGAEVRLFRKSNEGLIDLTQRTSTETEREIAKILKMNFRTFSNSILLPQADFAGIAGMTPRERKAALKEALQLGIYSKYEIAVKKKISDLSKEIDRAKIILSTLGDPEKDIADLKTTISANEPLIADLDNSIVGIIKDIRCAHEEVITSQKSIDSLYEQIELSKKSLIDIDKEITSLSNDESGYRARIDQLKKKEAAALVRGKALHIEIKKLKSIAIRSEDDIRNDLTSERSKLIECKTNHKLYSSKLAELQIPLSEDAICKHCRQTVEPEFRKACQNRVDKEVIVMKSLLVDELAAIAKRSNKVMELDSELNGAARSVALLDQKQRDISQEKKDLESINLMLQEINSIHQSKDKELQSKIEAKKNIVSTQSSSSLYEKSEKLKEVLKDTKSKQASLESARAKQTEQLTTLSNQQAVLKHKLSQREIDAQKVIENKKGTNDLEVSFHLHQKVLAAFGPNGIPALITHTVLDDYQREANLVLDRLRPGLRLQFLVEEKRGKDDEMADTLEITYFLNNTELEFYQLSGAQKLIAALSLRLGLAAVIKTRLGIDLKMLLIDEADQPLDEATLETFEQTIRELRKEYKVLLITHNNSVKAHFSHAIVVEQDSSLTSTASVQQGW